VRESGYISSSSTYQTRNAEILLATSQRRSQEVREEVGKKLVLQISRIIVSKTLPKFRRNRRRRSKVTLRNFSRRQSKKRKAIDKRRKEKEKAKGANGSSKEKESMVNGTRHS